MVKTARKPLASFPKKVNKKTYLQWCLFIVKLPVLSAHRALLLRLGVEPLDDAVDMEAVRAGPPHQRTVVSGKLAVRTATVERHTTDAAVIVVRHPAPGRHARPTYA